MPYLMLSLGGDKVKNIIFEEEEGSTAIFDTIEVPCLLIDQEIKSDLHLTNSVINIK